MLLGLAQTIEIAHESVKAIPKIAIVAPPAAYQSSSGRSITVEHIDLVARAISMENTHRTFPATSSMCTAVAAAVEGTVVHEVSRAATTERLRLGHPAGIMEVGAKVYRRGSDWEVESVTTQRTARRIMEGVYPGTAARYGRQTLVWDGWAYESDAEAHQVPPRQW